MLFLSFVSVVAALQASIYKFPQSEHRHEVSALLSPAEARQVWSELFQVTRYHKLGFVGQQAKVIDTVKHNSELLWGEPEGSIVLNIAGVTDEGHVFPDSRALYKIDESPRSEAYSDLLVRLLHQADDLRGEKLEKVYGNAKGGGLYLSPPLKVPFDSTLHGPSMTRFRETYGNKIASTLDLKILEDRLFITEMSALESFVDALSSAPTLDSQFAAGHLVSLETLYHKYGPHSAQYTAAVSAMKTCLSTLPGRLISQKMYITLLPPAALAQSPLQRRSGENAGAFGDQHAAPILELAKNSNSMCFDTQAICENATESCSGHGSCSQYLGQEGCYVCQCSPTVENRTAGRKTTHWAGPTCAKKDVSVPFQIFFWFFIAMVATVVFSVRLLYSIDMSSNTLSATGHMKKE